MVEPAGNISSVLGVVLQVGKWVAAPIGRRFMYLYNYNTNFDNLQAEVNRLKDAKDRVERKVDAAERNVEEIEGNVKTWQNNVEKTIVQAERLIQDKSNNPRCLKGLCPNLKTRYKHSKKAFKLKRDDIGPLLQQEEKFDRVSYASIPQSNYEKNFDKLRDDVLKLKNARLKVQRKVEEAKIKEEEIEEDVKKWLEDVDSIIAKAEELIENQSSIGTDRKTRYQNSKAASDLMVADIGPLLQQEERFDNVSYSITLLSNYEKNFDKLRDDVLKLKNARLKVQRKVEEAKIKEEEIEEDVKKWLEDVDSIIAKAEELIENQSSIGTDRKTRYQNSKAASDLMVADIGPLLQQEERFDNVSYSITLLSNYETNFVKLRDAVLKLKNARRKVQRKVEKAKNNVEEIEEDVKKWLEDVDSIIVKAEELIENQSSIGTDRKTRYQNSKAASELMVDNIGPLLQQEERFDKVSHATIHKEIWLRYNEDYLAFESRNTTEKNVWEALKDEKIYMIGVYGMGGLGKTTLVQEIGRKAEKDKLFDEIVFVEVTETPDIKKIQTVIANKLGVKFDDAAKEDESRRASKLYSRIENKNIFLIVDNIWGELDLKIVGIPSRADRGRSKILMTTRNVDVLEKMGSTKNFGMGILNEEEAWSLFKKMAGGEIPTCELNSLPQDVCKECGGLPIVICTIAKALKRKRCPSDWKVALRELKAPSPAKFIGLLEKEYMKIALSYKYLRDDELKKTFLISSLMKNNTSISDFFIHVVGLDILEGANLKMEEARDRLDTLVRDLKDSCLLTDGFTSKQFAMHDVVRAVAITVSYTDHHVFTWRNDVEREWKDKDKLKKCTKISLTDRSTVISELWPNDLDCPNLEYFYMATMWGSCSSFEIPEDFFTVMPKLKVLNLFGMQQSMLSSSLDLLTNLQTLCLNGSNIEDVAIIGKLKKLKVLSLQDSSIKELPTKLGQLTQLRLLDLSNCRQLKVIVPNVISKLSQLEELYIKGCSIQWKVEVLKELKLLSQLASLELDIKDNKMLPKDLFSKELKRYKITVGDWFLSTIDLLFLSNLSSRYTRYDEYKGLRMFELELNSTISLEELQGIRNVELLRLADFSDVENCFNDFVTLTPLLNEKVIFTDLMALELQNISCGKIWDSKFPTLTSSCYKGLTRFILERCGKIKYVFPFSIAKRLEALQYLEIKDCEVLEEIVAEEEGAKASINFAFLQITNLKLENLPKLKAFYPGIHSCEWPMLKKLVINECGKFTSKCLSFQENSFHIPEPKSLCLEHKINLDLEVLELRNGGKEIIWNSKALMIKGVELANILLRFLQRSKNLKELKLKDNMYNELFFPTHLNLEVLDVSCCHRLMQLITPLMAKSLVQLKEMSVKNCEMLIEIVENEGDATSTEIVFNNLKTLSLENLESLTCFCSGNYSFNFPFLEELNIRKCPSMKTFSRGIVSTPKLYKVRNDKSESKLKDLEIEENKLNTFIQQAHKEKVSFAGVVHNLPEAFVQTLNQRSYVMSMDFHPQQQTILLVGTNIGDISLWEVGSGERLAHRTFKVWDISATSMPLQALLNDATIWVNRCVWGPDGLMLGVAFSEHIVQIYTYNATGELRQHLEIDAHVGGVNDIAFAHPNKQLCIVTCGDDKTIKVWDAVAGRRQYTFEGHEAPVYSVCPYYKENIEFIFSTATDGTIKYWLYDCLRSRGDYDAPGRYCTMMAYSADGTRLFLCGPSKEGDSYLVEWNESEGAIKRTYRGFKERSLGVFDFDTTRNRFLAAGDECQIKFWDMDNRNMLTAVDVDGGLLGCPRLRFNKEGSLLAVTSDKVIKILANSDGFVSINSLGPMDNSRLVDVKPCFADDGDKIKSWNIRDVSDPSQMKALRLPDSIAPSKVVRLIYTNSGLALLALTASAVHKLWKWQRSDRNPLGKATAYVAPQLWQSPTGTLMTNDINDGKTAEESAACIALSKNDSYVISASGGKVSLFNIMTFEVMTMFMPPPPAVTYLAFYPQDNNIIAIGMEDSTIQIYNVQVDEVKTELRGHQDRITGLAFSQTLNALVSSGADAQLCMWSIDKWEKLKSRFIQAPAGRQSPLVGETKVQFHNDQTHLLVVHDSQISIYDSKLECSRSWSPKDTLPAPISSAIYSCDGLLVYVGFCDGAVGVFDADNLRLRCRIAASAYIPSFSVNSNTTTYPFVIAAHPSERNQIALGMSDGAVHVVEPSDAELKCGWHTFPRQWFPPF